MMNHTREAASSHPLPVADTPQSSFGTYVIGAGPAGLAVASQLSRMGQRVTILEATSEVGASWRTHREGLRLHTTRRLSALPGVAIPRSSGTYVSSRDVVRYLELYAATTNARVQFDTKVTAIDRAPGGEAGARWRVTTAAGEVLSADTVVVATGYNNRPHIPDWRGIESFVRPIVHASHYRRVNQFAGLHVLVVGSGNAAAEATMDLMAGGAARISMSVRTTPHFVRKRVGPFSAQAVSIVLARFPHRVADRIAALLSRMCVRDTTAFGIPRPPADLFTRTALTRSVPTQDKGLVAAIRSGQIEPVSGVVGFDRHAVLLADGATLTPDVVIAATGYRRGLCDLVDSDSFLDADGVPVTDASRAAAPGLYFIGYTVSVTGALRDIAMDARRIARREARDARDARDAPHPITRH